MGHRTSSAEIILCDVCKLARALRELDGVYYCNNCFRERARQIRAKHPRKVNEHG